MYKNYVIQAKACKIKCNRKCKFWKSKIIFFKVPSVALSLILTFGIAAPKVYGVQEKGDTYQEPNFVNRMESSIKHFTKSSLDKLTAWIKVYPKISAGACFSAGALVSVGIIKLVPKFNERALNICPKADVELSVRPSKQSGKKDVLVDASVVSTQGPLKISKFATDSQNSEKGSNNSQETSMVILYPPPRSGDNVIPASQTPSPVVIYPSPVFSSQPEASSPTQHLDMCLDSSSSSSPPNLSDANRSSLPAKSSEPSPTTTSNSESSPQISLSPESTTPKADAKAGNTAPKKSKTKSTQKGHVRSTSEQSSATDIVKISKKRSSGHIRSQSSSDLPMPSNSGQTSAVGLSPLPPLPPLPPSIEDKSNTDTTNKTQGGTANGIASQGTVSDKNQIIVVRAKSFVSQGAGGGKNPNGAVDGGCGKKS